MPAEKMDTIIMIESTEVPVHIKFQYQPEEPATFDYPGASLEITGFTSCTHNGAEVPDWVFNAALKQLTADALERVQTIEQYRKPAPHHFNIANALSGHFA